MKELKYKYWFANMNHINAATKRKLLHFFGSEREIFFSSEAKLSRIPGLSPEAVSALAAAGKDENWLISYEKFLEQKIQLICWGQENYPERLKHIYNPPYSLFVKGDLPQPDSKNIAIVGARGCSAYGQTVAANLGKMLAKCGVGVISGLAYGIDAASHRGALEGEGRVYGILGCGVDVCYPAANCELYEQVTENGGIISEFAMGTQPQKMFFPLRNRIISGLSDGVVVVEARKHSGSLITADCAIEQGKTVYAVPGRINDSLSYGTNWLLSQGAVPLYSVEEFLRDAGIWKKTDKKQKNLIDFPLAKNERLVYSVLDLTPRHLETVIKETGLDFPAAMNAVYSLIECGCVKEVYKNHYIKTEI